MSASRSCCTCMDFSGVKKTLSPSTGERNLTPSSLILRISASENTWKPPESVSIGPSQCMNSCNPPWFRMISVPGRNMRWKVLPRMISAPLCATSSGVTLLTQPYVPTGMKAGVRTSPRRSRSVPHLAAPHDFPGANFIGEGWQSLLLRWQEQHGVTITEKPISTCDSVAIRFKNAFPACECRHQ